MTGSHHAVHRDTKEATNDTNTMGPAATQNGSPDVMALALHLGGSCGLR